MGVVERAHRDEEWVRCWLGLTSLERSESTGLEVCAVRVDNVRVGAVADQKQAH